MYNKKNKKILSERIAEVLSSAPISGSVDPEDEDLLITPNILDGSNNGANVDSEDELLLSNFRKKNLDLLEDTDTRYAGKRSSRKSLNDCDNESLDAEDSKTESSDEEEGEEEEEDYEKGKEETSDIAVENITKFKHINESTSSQVTKGLCVQNQMNMWESLLEIRIQLQKCLLAANKMPQEDLYKELHRQAGSEFTNKINDTKKSVSNVLDKMLNFQKILLKKYPETKHLDKENKKEVKQNKESDEEIPSDTESEHEPESESEDDIEAPRKKIKLQDYESQISDLHGTYKTYRDSVIEKWNAKTRTLLAKNNVKSYTVLNQIEHILSDKAKLIKRTQLKKSSYHILGEDSKDQNDDNSRINSIEDFNSEIFDDDDFYHQLLRELIEVKSADITDPVQLGRQWIQLQNIRSKMKRKVDTKATKGRKIRYGVHSKLVNFMAPMEENGWTDEAKNELFGSLFGKSHTSVSV